MRVVFLFTALVCAFASTIAQTRVDTPLLPVRVVPVGNNVHILCSRIDVNFNGNLDEDDHAAAWLVLDAATRQLVRVMEFGWSHVQTQRFGVVDGGSSFDIGFGTEVYRFSTETQANTDIVYSGDFSSVSSSNDGKRVWIAQRPNFTDPGSIVEVDVESRSTQVFPAGVNPQAPIAFTTSQQTGLVGISEGTFGGANGTLDIWTMVSGSRSRTTIDVGDTPNHVLVANDMAYVTVNGSHWVVVVDLTKQTPVDTIFVGTAGFDGPRESAIDSGLLGAQQRLYVSTFSSDVRVFDLPSGTYRGRIDVGAKPEGLAVIGRQLWVTRSFEKGGYTAVSDVAVFDLDDPTTVSQESTTTPMPTAIFATQPVVPLPFAVGQTTEIHSIDGRKTVGAVVDSELNTIDVSSLPRGTYVVRNGVHTVTLMR